MLLFDVNIDVLSNVETCNFVKGIIKKNLKKYVYCHALRFVNKFIVLFCPLVL